MENEIKQEIKQLRNQYHEIDKKLECFQATSSTQHAHIESLLKESISRDDARLSNHSDRIDKLEDDITQIKTESANRKSNNNILLGLGTIAATIIAVIVGIVIDHYIIK